MGINGLLTDVRWEWTGTEVTADLITGTTVLPVLDPEAITEGENVWIAETGPYEVVDADVDAATLTITPGLLLDIDSETEVATDIGGQPGRAWVCEVILADSDVPIEVPLTVHDLAVMPEGFYDPPVVIVLSDDLESVENLPGSLPTIDGIYIPPDTIPAGPQGVPGPPGADGAPQYTWVKYADTPTSGMSDDPTGKVYMGLSYNHDNPTESSNYSDYQWSKVQGDPGPPAGVIDLSATTQVLTQPAAGGATTPATAVVTGVGTNTTITTYEYSSDGAGFTGTPPAGVSRSGNVVTITGATMVAKTITVRMSNGAGISDSLTVSRVSEGAGGAPGPQGPPGTGVSGTVVTYQVGSSGTSAPTGTWLSTPPATTPGTFLWTRTITTYTDSSTSTAYSVAAHGTTGNPGAPGPPGDDGAPGAPGRGIASTAVTYQVGTDGTSAPTGAWVASPPATTPGTFLWTRTVTTYTDATTSTAYSVAAHGATGGPGSPGSPGAPGVGVSGTVVTYQVGSSGTSAPTGSWVSSPPATTPGTFLWTRTVTTYTDASTSTAYSVAAHGATGSTGSPGNPGAPGVGVASTAVTYQIGSSGTVAPTGSWVGSPPATSPGQFLWTRTITTYTDLTTSTGYSVAAHGSTGSPGADAYTIIQSNEAHTFPGSVTAALAGSATTVFTAYKGINPINAAINNANITGAPTGMSTAVSGSPGTPTVTITVTTALVQQSGTLTIPVVVDGFTFNKIFSWSVSRQGTQGTPGTPGADGTPRYTWTKYADNATGTVGFSDVPLSTTKYLGMAYNQLTLTESNNPGDYQWVLVQGPTGPAGPTSDGLAPATSPTPVVIGGIGAIFVRWAAPVNHDPLTYDLHVSTTTGFTPDSTTLVTSSPATSFTMRSLPTGVGDPPDTSLKYGTIYYFKVIARDVDGAAPVGAEANGSMMQVAGPDVAAESITGNHIVGGTITGDLLAGQVILGSTISTGSLDDTGNIVGARIDLGPDGMQGYAVDGHQVLNFPTDPTDEAYVEAHFHMLSADVEDHFTLYGVNNAVAASASILLASGVTAPSSPPTLSQTYDTVQLDVTTKVASAGTPGSGFYLGTFNLDPSQITSMAWDQVYGCWQVFQQRGNGMRLWRFTTTGALFNNLSGKPWIDDFENETHVTGGRGGWIQKWTDGKWYIWDTVIGGGRWGIVPNSWLIDGSTADPFCSFDETGPTLMLCQMNTSANDTMQIRRVHSVPYVGGAIQNLVNDSTTNSPVSIQKQGSIIGVYYGAADFGGNRYVTATDVYARFNVWTASTRFSGAANFAEWDAPSPAKAFAYDGANFWSCDGGGKLTKYTGWTWPQEPATTWVGASAYDSRTVGPPVTTTHETPVGTLATKNAARRSKLTITVPPTQDAGGQDDPNQWRIYLARTTGATPTAAMMHLITAIGSPSVSTSTTIQADPTGIAPPGGIFGQAGAVNTFPAGNPAKILDGAGNTMVDAQGHGGVGMVGEVRMYAGATAPVGWLICDGSDVSRTTYAALYAIIGNTFGNGNGTTTFNLPDMRSRLPLGVGSIATLGQTEQGTPTGLVGSPPAEDAGRGGRWSHVHWHNAVTPDGTLSTGNQTLNQQTNTTTGGTANRLTQPDTHNHSISGHTSSSSALSGGAGTVPSVHASTALYYIIRY